MSYANRAWDHSGRDSRVTMWDLLRNPKIRSLPREIARLELRIALQRKEMEMIGISLQEPVSAMEVRDLRRRNETLSRRIDMDFVRLEAMKAERERISRAMEAALDGGK